MSTKTGINEPVSGDEAPEKLSRFAEGLPTLLETLSIDTRLDEITFSDIADRLRNILNSFGHGLVEITAKILNVVDSEVPL